MPSYFVWLPFGKISGFLVFQLSVFTTAGHWQQRSRQRAHVIRPKQFCWFPFRYVRCGNLHFDRVGLSNCFRFLHNTLLSLFRIQNIAACPAIIYSCCLLFRRWASCWRGYRPGSWRWPTTTRTPCPPSSTSRTSSSFATAWTRRRLGRSLSFLRDLKNLIFC